ncbi:MAG: hypothetical protein SWK76_11940 [Actinomycetota bacterium]|nr:hypothetical protein [Actinomycetota bacterium]
MRMIPRKQMEELLSAYIGGAEGLPEIDMDGQIAFIEEYFRVGSPELSWLFYMCNTALRIVSFIYMRRSFSRLSQQERGDLLNTISSSRNPLIRGLAVLLGLPIFMSYYRREEVSVPLGFDPRALKEEANLRTVSRDRELPPKKEEPS